MIAKEKPGTGLFASDLPAADGLSVCQARALAVRLRTEIRPAVIRSLHRLYAAAPDRDQTDLEADTLAEELRLQELDLYLSKLLDLLARHDPSLVGWDAWEPRLLDLELTGDAAASACCDLVYTPDNHDCVHGPLTVLPVISLAETILRPGESLVELLHISWRRPIRSRIHLEVRDAATMPAPRWPDVCLDAALTTSTGRRLELVARPLSDHPVTGQAGLNRLSFALLGGQRIEHLDQPRSLGITLSRHRGAEYLRHATSSQARLAAMMLDLAPLLILTICPGVPMLGCGFQNVPLPATAAELLAPGCRLEIRHLPEQSHVSARSGLTISWYELGFTTIPDQPSRTAMAEARSPHEMLRFLYG